MISALFGKWLATNVGRIIIIVLAIAGAILIPVTVYQTIHISGLSFPFPVFGKVTLVTGLTDQLAAAKQEVKDADSKMRFISVKCTEATEKARLDGEKALADQEAKTLAAEQALAAAQARSAQRERELKRILANAKPGDERPLGPTVLDYIDRLRGP